MVFLISLISNIIVFIPAISAMINILLIARETTILEHHEEGKEYKGFWSSVMGPLSSTGGISHRILPMPWFDFSNKDDFERMHIVKKNWFVLGFWLSIGLFIFLGHLLG